MKNDKLYTKIKNALMEERGEYSISEDEIERLAALISTVTNSPLYIREIFYTGVTQIAIKIGEILKKQEEEILSKITKKNDGNKGGNILN